MYLFQFETLPVSNTGLPQAASKADSAKVISSLNNAASIQHCNKISLRSEHGLKIKMYCVYTQFHKPRVNLLRCSYSTSE